MSGKEAGEGFPFPSPLSYLTLSSRFLSSQHNHLNEGMDINVTGVWERNITGRGVTVVVVDDGVEHTHRDLQSNYVSQHQQSFFDPWNTPFILLLGHSLCPAVTARNTWVFF